MTLEEQIPKDEISELFLDEVSEIGSSIWFDLKALIILFPIVKSVNIPWHDVATEI